MKTRNILLIAILSIFTLSSCTENQRAKTFGGNIEITIPCGEKITEVTWKNDELWYATRSMRINEVAENTTFKEESSFGILEGSVTFIECN